eukprot:gene5159-6275_t
MAGHHTASPFSYTGNEPTPLRHILDAKTTQFNHMADTRNKSLEILCSEKDAEAASLQSRFNQLKEDFEYNLRLIEERDSELSRLESSAEELRAVLTAKDDQLGQCKKLLSGIEEQVQEGKAREARQDQVAQQLQEQLQVVLGTPICALLAGGADRSGRSIERFCGKTSRRSREQEIMRMREQFEQFLAIGGHLSMDGPRDGMHVVRQREEQSTRREQQCEKRALEMEGRTKEAEAELDEAKRDLARLQERAAQAEARAQEDEATATRCGVELQAARQRQGELQMEMENERNLLQVQNGTMLYGAVRSSSIIGYMVVYGSVQRCTEYEDKCGSLIENLHTVEQALEQQQAEHLSETTRLQKELGEASDRAEKSEEEVKRLQWELQEARTGLNQLGGGLLGTSGEWATRSGKFTGMPAAALE